MASKKKPAAGRGEPEGFEALYKRLEETVARLEEGGLTLDESLALYEEGMKLAQRCQEMLQQADLRVARLQEQFGELREEPESYSAGAEEETPFE